MCHYVFMYDERDNNTNSQTNSSIKYIYQTIQAWSKMKFTAAR